MSTRVLLLSLLGVGCASWHAQPLTPHQVISEMRPKRVRLILVDSSVVLLKHPEIAGDSIAGKFNGTRTAVAADRVARTEIRVPHDPPADGFFYSWHTQRQALQQVLSKKHPDRIRVTLADSTVLVLMHPVLLRDSIVGMVSGTRTAFASHGIARIETRAESAWKMMAFMSAYVLVFSWGCSQGSSPDCTGSAR